MEGTRKEDISLEKFLKRSWPVLAFGAVLLVVASSLLFSYAVKGTWRKADSENATTTPQTVEATSTSSLVPRSLDGVLVSPEEARLQPYAVIVENHTDARPLSGPAAANLAFEIPVEGGITRYLLAFDATTTVDAIGPVRSARPYFVDLSDGLNAVFGHVGGSPEALGLIGRTSSLRDLNEYSNGKYFWRSKKREAPHNVYTRTDLLHEADAAKKWSVGNFRSWSYKEDDPLESATGTVRGDVDGPIVKYGGSYSASWKYDKATNLYQRYESGQKQADQDGTEVKAKNVVIMQTDGSVLDSVGRLKIRTTGRGKAVLYRDGKKEDIMWQRNAGEHISFQTVEGADALLDRGTTWIQVVIDSKAFDISGSATTTSAK